VIRDLESMKFDNSEEYCPPYCEKHLENYVLDFSNRVKLHTQKKENEKVAHWAKVHNSYRSTFVNKLCIVQLVNLHHAAKRSQQE
jgi:hypothetical protein